MRNKPKSNPRPDDEMVFEVRGDQPIPMFPKPGGPMIDGSKFIDAAQCALRYGKTEDAWRKEWMSVWGPYLAKSAPVSAGKDPVFYARPYPCLPDPTGEVLYPIADGKSYLTAQQCSERFGGSAESWLEAWRAMLRSEGAPEIQRFGPKLPGAALRLLARMKGVATELEMAHDALGPKHHKSHGVGMAVDAMHRVIEVFVASLGSEAFTGVGITRELATAITEEGLGRKSRGDLGENLAAVPD